MYIVFLFFFKQKTAYEMRISDWSSDVCSSDLNAIDADDKVLLVMACEKLHNARAIVQDLENPAVGQAVFEGFNGGRDGSLAYYHSPAHVFAPRAVPVAGAFENAVGRSHQLAGHAPALTQALLVESHRERAAAWGVGVR